MKISINNQKEALDYVFGRFLVINVRLDKRLSSTKQVLKYFSISELENIQNKKVKRYSNEYHYSPVLDILEEVATERRAGNYQKILIPGNSHIYWASPAYLHEDYNKSVWKDNTPENRKKMEIINSLISK